MDRKQLHSLGGVGFSPWHDERVVYGSFSRAGRFSYWVGAEKSAPMAQKDVEYGPRFRDMTREQVRAGVYHILKARLADTGEA
jgi:hypothetical protein